MVNLSAVADSVGNLDAWLSPSLREALEQTYWAPIEALTAAELLADDERFVSDPGGHFALFSDHGVVHVRDVAARAAALTTLLNGVLFARRDERRLAFMTTFVVAAAYLHDIGMIDTSPHGRRVHADFAAQEPFAPRFDDLLQRLWDEPGRVLAGRVEELAGQRRRPDGLTVTRELLSLAFCHSKTAAPAALLNDHAALAARLRRSVFTPLPALGQRGDVPLGEPTGPALRCYQDPLGDSYRWLESDDHLDRQLADDAVDALRVLRAADALRQRGTTLRTTSGFEVFVEPARGHAVFGLRRKDRTKIVYLRVGHPLSSGEANLARAELTAAGDLEMAFHRGAFEDRAATAFAARAAATVVADIASDVLGSFDTARPAQDLAQPAVPAGASGLRLLRPPDAPGFGDEVADHLRQAAPAFAARLTLAPPEQAVVPDEPSWTERGEAVPGDSELADLLLRRLAGCGLRTQHIDRNVAFDGVRLVRVDRGERVITAGRRATFVAVPLEEGLAVVSLGGYRRQPGRPWIPVGITGVIRGAERNSTILAERRLALVVIPGPVFARHWFHPYDEHEARLAAHELRPSARGDLGP